MTVTASVGEVPEHHLLVREPVKRTQAAAAEGGVRRTVTASTLAAVRGPQTLTLQASPANLDVGEQAAVTAAVTGDGSPRTGHGHAARAVRLRVRGHLLRRVRGHHDHDA